MFHSHFGHDGGKKIPYVVTKILTPTFQSVASYFAKLSWIPPPPKEKPLGYLYCLLCFQRVVTFFTLSRHVTLKENFYFS
jgi:hypothetical protein